MLETILIEKAEQEAVQGELQFSGYCTVCCRPERLLGSDVVFFSIDVGERGVTLRFGAVDRVVAEGIHAKWPFMETMVKMNTRAHVYKSLGLGYAERVIEPIVKEGFEAASACYTAEELISKREMLNNEVRDYLKNRMVPFGIMVVALSIIDFELSPEFNRAIEKWDGHLPNVTGEAVLFISVGAMREGNHK